MLVMTYHLSHDNVSSKRYRGYFIIHPLYAFSIIHSAGQHRRNACCVIVHLCFCICIDVFKQLFIVAKRSNTPMPNTSMC